MTIKVVTQHPKWAFDKEGPKYRVSIDGVILPNVYLTRQAAQLQADRYRFGESFSDCVEW